MINNFVIFPKTKERYVKVCNYDPTDEKNIADFAFTAEECDKIIALWNEQQSAEARTGADAHQEKPDYTKRKSRIVWLRYNESTAWIFVKLFMAVNDANQARFQFDLNGFFEDLQLTKYENDGGHYDWHEDSGDKSFSVRKLSIVVQLTDPAEYEGGEFEIMGEGKAKKTKGTIFVMPSFVTHKVHPVTSGTRFSLVAWVSGPPFR